MIIELTNEQLEHLKEGAEAFGRASLLTETNDGEDVFVVVSASRRRGRPPRRTANGPAHLEQGASGPAGIGGE